MLFEAPDYTQVLKKLRKHKSQFANDQELNKYVNNHPEIIIGSLAGPMPSHKALLLSLQLIVPGLRATQQVVSSCEVVHFNQYKFVFNIYKANLRTSRYWYFLDNELQHTHSVPIWHKRLLKFRRPLVQGFDFWEVWHRLPQKNVVFNYINYLPKLNLRRQQRLYAMPTGVKRQPHLITLHKYLYKRQVKLLKPLQPINTDLYLIGMHKYIIQSKPLERKLKNED